MTMPPSGRATNPMAKVAKEASVPASGEIWGKNCGAKTTAAAVP